MNLIRHKTILSHVYTSAGLAYFNTFDEDTGDEVEIYELPEDLWVDMGSPTKITVSIESGDLLNV